MKKTKSLVISVSLILLFSATFISASHTPAGPKCLPLDSPDKPQTCILCPEVLNPSEVHLSWEISNANFTKPYCTLNCKNGNDSCPKVTRKEDGYAANAADYINGIRAIRTVTMEDYYDSHNLAPVDDVFIKDQAGQPSFELEAGNQYTISCCEATEPFNILNPCKDNTNRQGPVKTIAGCGGPCEVPSSVIFENLLKGNHINISETNFRDWGINQQVDNANLSNNLGSGDLEDIKNAMSVSQACFGFVSQIDPVNDIGEMVIRDIKKITDKLKPASVNIIYKPFNNSSKDNRNK